MTWPHFFGPLCRVPKIRCQCVWLSDCKKLESICIIVYRGKACIRVTSSIVIVCIYSYIHSWTRGVSCRDVIISRQQWQFSQHCALQPIVVVTDCSIIESLLPLNARQFVCRFRCMPCQRRWRLISPFNFDPLIIKLSTLGRFLISYFKMFNGLYFKFRERSFASSLSMSHDWFLNDT